MCVLAFLIGGTACLIPQLGREFMPELEEGNLWLRGIGPLNMNLDHQVAIAKQARAIMAGYPEVESIVTQSGRPDDGTDTEGYYSGEYFVPLRRQEDWPKLMPATGWRRWVYGPLRARTKRELVDAMNAELERDIPGVDVELLAEHPRQRDGGAVRGQGRQFAQDLRPGPRQVGAAGRQGQEHPARASRASPTWASSTSAGRRTWSSASIR